MTSWRNKVSFCLEDPEGADRGLLYFPSTPSDDPPSKAWQADTVTLPIDSPVRASPSASCYCLPIVQGVKGWAVKEGGTKEGYQALHHAMRRETCRAVTQAGPTEPSPTACIPVVISCVEHASRTIETGGHGRFTGPLICKSPVKPTKGPCHRPQPRFHASMLMMLIDTACQDYLRGQSHALSA